MLALQLRAAHAAMYACKLLALFVFLCMLALNVLLHGMLCIVRRTANESHVWRSATQSFNTPKLEARTASWHCAASMLMCQTRGWHSAAARIVEVHLAFLQLKLALAFATMLVVHADPLACSRPICSRNCAGSCSQGVQLAFDREGRYRHAAFQTCDKSCVLAFVAPTRGELRFAAQLAAELCRRSGPLSLPHESRPLDQEPTHIRLAPATAGRKSGPKVATPCNMLATLDATPGLSFMPAGKRRSISGHQSLPHCLPVVQEARQIQHIALSRLWGN